MSSSRRPNSSRSYALYNSSTDVCEECFIYCDAKILPRATRALWIVVVLSNIISPTSHVFFHPIGRERV
ncbi:hypothetical protein PFISCL1PPCAC_18426 [Pristionchus fissidentatus]|uniref:G protein-coupled receptor n=1 Tax=Pristionchus fissidentatus TaxID=1538716 RepID=A0AAV5WBC8_9BILA|nr:hypothetical protein PFISCL1PPCAC_18426 [Pristionchus fissidentatus]